LSTYLNYFFIVITNNNRIIFYYNTFFFYQTNLLHMCTELFLAFLYFFILFSLNFFLFRLLKNYFETIKLLEKFKRIFFIYKPNKLDRFLFFLSFFQEKKISGTFSNELYKIADDTEDILLIGNTLKIFQQEKKINTTENYYFQLLEKQYLSSFFSKKEN